MSKKKIEIKQAKVIRSTHDKVCDFYAAALNNPDFSFSECLQKADLSAQEFLDAYNSEKATVEAFEEVIDFSLAFDTRRAFVQGINGSENIKDACKLGESWLATRFNLAKVKIEQQKLDAVLQQSKDARGSEDDPSKFEVVLNL